MEEETREVWYAVYEVETGKLLSTGTDLADPLPEGVEAVEIPGPPTRDVEWDPKKHVFAAKPPPPEPTPPPEPPTTPAPRPGRGDRPII